MFGKITSSPSNPKLSFEEMLCNKITKQKKKNEEKEKGKGNLCHLIQIKCI